MRTARRSGLKNKIKMENMKYKLTDETKVVNNITLHRIECVTAFDDIECGAKGGWIESEKNLSQCGSAWVCENATVGGNARISENAWIDEYAKVGGNARISGNAWVYGNATVSDNATVSGNARISGDAKVGGNARISENAWIDEYAKVGGNARISGNAEVFGDARVDGNAIVREGADYIVFKNWWSSGRYFTWTRSNNKWKVGCFYGTGDELVAKAYKDSEKSGREYERVVKYVESILQEEDNGNRNKREG